MSKDKSIIENNQTLTSSGGVAGSNVGLYPYSTDGSAVANRPLTVSGLRWNVSFTLATAATAVGGIKWCVWIRRKGQAVPGAPIATGPADAFGAIDESDILIWGASRLLPGAAQFPYFEGATKTQRKMQQGDTLVLSCWTATGGATDVVSVSGMFQTFFKS